LEPESARPTATLEPSGQSLLRIEDAAVIFAGAGGAVRAVDGVSLELQHGETLAVVGESGCGKTTLARAVLGLQPLAAGRIKIGGREVRGVARHVARQVGMVWQDPYASLNPKWPIGRSILEPVRLVGEKVDATEILEEVGLDPKMAGRYPHQLSGGQRQRAAIGRALVLKPPLIICDEPTAALDLSIRAQILNLLKRIQRTHGCSLLYISHDLLTVQFLASKVAVMYMGQIVEQGPTAEVFASPRHPYTRALLDSAPSLDKLLQLPKALPGELPDPRQLPRGCRFANRCERRQEICFESLPDLEPVGERRWRCYFPVEAPIDPQASSSKGKL
jgi:oligopeptide/dipeptide ABC transporter ATP-binding protein